MKIREMENEKQSKGEGTAKCAHQEVEEDEDGERDEGVERPRGREQRGPVAAEDEGVVGDADDGEDEQDHD
jgi:hypothetical protein